MSSRIKTSSEEIDNGIGYSTNFSLGREELHFIQDEIRNQWIYRIQIESAKLAAIIYKNNLSIVDYHQICGELDHSKLWKKTTRILSSQFTRWFFKTSFVGLLEQEFGLFEISDEEGLGWPNIYWRIVRPREANDVGPMHRDSWFWDLNESYTKPSYSFKRIKVWIPIHINTGLNGLLVEDYSHHRKDIRFKGEERYGLKKPMLINPPGDINSHLLKVKEGEAIIFNDNLLHGGAINKAEKCRVSIEFTMLTRCPE